MNSHLDASLNEVMRSHVDNFFASLREGTPALNSFLGTLSTFNTTIRTHHNNLRAETLVAVKNFVSLISTLTLDVRELETTTEQILNTSASEIVKILSFKMSNLSISDTQGLKPSKGHPAYIKPSYQWLLLNLHNPYPSKEVKKDISRQTNCSVKDIDAWFIDARKRIGWNKLRKTRFSNKQEMIIAAATHIFRPKQTSFSDDPNAGLLSEMDPNDMYRGEFLAMANRARSLYADRFPGLVAPFSYGNTAMHISSVGHSKTVVEENECLGPVQISQTDTDFASYPTPEPSSPSGLREECLRPTTFPSFNEAYPKSLKRGQSLANLSEDNSYVVRPSKRFRPCVPQISNASAVASLPSPSQTIESIDEPSDDSDSLSEQANSENISVPVMLTSEGNLSIVETASLSTHPLSTEAPPLSEISSMKRKRRLSGSGSQDPAKHIHLARTLPEVVTGTPIGAEISTLKRKRRLSDGESQLPLKRPHNALAHPRLQTVSDPFPLAKLWLGNSFEISSGHGDVSEQTPLENPLPRHMEVPLSLAAPQEACDAEFNSAITYLEPCSEDYLSYVVSEEATVPIYPSETSDLFSDSFVPSYLDTAQSSSSNIIVTTANFPDFNALLSAPEYDLTNPNQFTSINEDLSHWFTSLQSDNSCAPLNPSALVLSNPDIEHLSHTDSLDVKRARLQVLKAQVSQLEGQLAGELTA